MSDQKDINDVTTREGVIEVLKEKLIVNKLNTVTGEVVINKTVETTETQVPLTTINTNYQEERVARNVVVEEMPAVRTEGDTIIIPVVREEAVVVKRLVLVEEIYLTREVSESNRTESVTLKNDSVEIIRN